MKEADLILGLFYFDENNIVFDNIKLSKGILENLPEINRFQLKMLSLRFLKPLLNNYKRIKNLFDLIQY